MVFEDVAFANNGVHSSNTASLNTEDVFTLPSDVWIHAFGHHLVSTLSRLCVGRVVVSIAAQLLVCFLSSLLRALLVCLLLRTRARKAAHSYNT